MKKIAVLCPGFGIIPRGIETVVKEVFFAIAEKTDYEIDIYCGAENKSIVAPKNIKIIQLKLPKFNTFFSRLYKRIARKLRIPAAEEYDFNFMIFAVKLLPVLFFKEYDIIFNNAGLYSAFVCRFYRKIFNVPYIHSGHAGINNLELALAKRKPDLYIASTLPAKKWLAECAPEIKTVVIPNGINPQIFKPYAITEEKIGLYFKMDRPVYLFVGALTKQKQPDKLLKAFIKNNNGSLIIIGAGELKNEILEIAFAAKLSKNKFLHIDNVEYDKLSDYFNFCDYFTMLSQNETFGIVYIMAISCNKPVLAEDSEQQRWMLEDAAVYCPANADSEILSNKLLELTKINFRNSPLKISKKYHWNNIVEKYEKIIEGLASTLFNKPNAAESD